MIKTYSNKNMRESKDFQKFQEEAEFMTVRPENIGQDKGFYRVFNSLSGREYEVHKFNNTIYCDCEAHSYRPNKKVPCKHIWKVLQFVKEQKSIVKKAIAVEEKQEDNKVMTFPLVENPINFDRTEVNNWKNFFRASKWSTLKIKAERERAIQKALVKPDMFYNNIIVACNEVTERKVA